MNTECTAIALLTANAENNLVPILSALVLAAALALYTAHLFSIYLNQYYQDATHPPRPTDQRS